MRPTVEEKEYEFDYVLSNLSHQEQTFNSVGKKIVSDVMDGYNGTIMAYGQVHYLTIDWIWQDIYYFWEKDLNGV
jgi:hypothetical protein